MTSFFVPLQGGGFGHHGPPWAGGPPAAFDPLQGVLMFLFTALAVLAVLFLLRGARGFGPPWARGGGPFASRSPEADAKRILAERFAKGDISTDEFMERASVLNWTPGSDNWEQWKNKKRKR